MFIFSNYFPFLDNYFNSLLAEHFYTLKSFINSLSSNLAYLILTCYFMKQTIGVASNRQEEATASP